MKILIVEDEFISRHLLQEILSPYGTCETAVNGREALEAFIDAIEKDASYDLICLDIMMPEIDGQETLKRIRAVEREHGVGGLEGVKIIMTTALEDFENIKLAFKEQCEGYLIKPITQQKMLKQLKELKLLKEDKNSNKQ